MASPIIRCVQARDLGCLLSLAGPETDTTETALMIASESGWSEGLEVLLDRYPGSAVSARTQSGNTCVHLAAKNGHAAAIRLLLAHGADAAATNVAKNTPLMFAAASGAAAAISALLEAPACVETIDATDSSGHTALATACLGAATAARLSDARETVVALIDSGANAALCDLKGRDARSILAEALRARPDDPDLLAMDSAVRRRFRALEARADAQAKSLIDEADRATIKKKKSRRGRRGSGSTRRDDDLPNNDWASVVRNGARFTKVTCGDEDPPPSPRPLDDDDNDDTQRFFESLHPEAASLVLTLRDLLLPSPTLSSSQLEALHDILDQCLRRVVESRIILAVERERSAILASAEQRPSSANVLVDERGRACAATRVSRGYGQLFEVVYSNGGGRFVCNAAHRLVLYFSSSSVFSSINDDDDDGYRVAYRDLAFDARLGFVAPIDRTIDFLVDKKKTQEATTPTLGDAKRSFGTLAEARAAALALFFFFEDRRRVWEPTVEQYVRFDRELDCCCFRMMRAAPEVLPLASPFPSLASLLDAAYADAEAAGGPRVARAERVSLAEVAYLVGACLGTAGKNRAVVEQPGSGGLDFLARVAPQEVKVRVDGHSRVPILSGSKKTKSKKRDGVVAPLRAVDPNKAHRRTKMPQSDSSRNVVACLLARLGNFGGEAVEHAFARAPADARASFLAGLVDANGSRHGASWTLEGEQRGLPIAMLAYRVALSLGFCASISRDDKNEVARITSPAGDGDVVSPRLAVASKKVPVDEDAS
ncbi:hypothetical protein CTAYLR_004723 [Chrysophaeum taylorii]|uniref:Uncharacterized protein n=1 Tax=Chrysophaeum taylorii TaxID=2483200 RepID=A0AAD7U7F4_9STRA|nr:hypothetical protein CTAYLR_004723 [Chrysophaeum taylorii]